MALTMQDKNHQIQNEEYEKVKCPNCHQKVDPTSGECPLCGAELWVSDNSWGDVGNFTDGYEE